MQEKKVKEKTIKMVTVIQYWGNLIIADFFY